MRTLTIVVFALLMAPAAVMHAENAPSAIVSIERMKKDINFLAGEECEGRLTGSPGNDKAAEFVAAAFKDAGLKPAGNDGYFQRFTFTYGSAKLGTPVALKLTTKDETVEAKYAAEFLPNGISGSGKAEGGLVFVGYGLSLAAPKYDDFAGVDVKGKIAVMIRRVPNYETGDKPKNPFQSEDNSAAAHFDEKAHQAIKHGAIGVIIVNDLSTSKEKDELLEFRRNAIESSVEIPVVMMKRKLLEPLFEAAGTTLEKVEAGINKSLKPNSFLLKDSSASIEITMTRPVLKARNIIGTLPGTGPLADEVVVIGAHYDHVGRNEFGNSMGGFPAKGKVHYGADDNASGTTGLIELARRFGSMKNRQGRRLVFVAFTGEELGLFGSKEYCKNPAFPLDQTAVMLNMDMIGRAKEVEDTDDHGKKKDRIVVYGHGTAEGFEHLVDNANDKFGFKMFKVKGGKGPSDHDSFYRKKIPVLFFFTGTHKDYHQPSDTPDKINFPVMNKVTDMVEMFVSHFATTLDRPKYVSVSGGSEDPTRERSASGGSRGGVGGMPKLGFTPGNYGEEDKGVLVDDVAEGMPALKAGIKPGDYIIEVAGKPVKNMDNYMAVMGAQKAGTEIEIVVQRKDQKVTVKATPK